MGPVDVLNVDEFGVHVLAEVDLNQTVDLNILYFRRDYRVLLFKLDPRGLFLTFFQQVSFNLR